MRAQWHLAHLVVSLVLASFQHAFAGQTGPVVWIQPTVDRVGTGETYDKDLLTFLSSTGGGQVLFYPADNRMPSWLHVVNDRRLKADAGHPAPADTGVFSFDIKATPGGDSGSFTTFT